MSDKIKFIVNQMGFRGLSMGYVIECDSTDKKQLDSLHRAAKVGFVKKVVKEVPVKKKWNPDWKENKKSKDKE